MKILTDAVNDFSKDANENVKDEEG